MSKRARPSSIADALTLPAVDLGDIAHITGLSYSTILADVRLGELHAGRHRKRFTVTVEELRRYLDQLGLLRPFLSASNTTTTSDTTTKAALEP